MSALTKSLHPDEKYKAGALGKPGAAVLAAGLGLLVVSALIGGAQGDGWSRFFHAYLVAWVGVVSIGVGSLYFVIIHHLVGAKWSTVLRRLAEIVTDTLPILFVAGLVIIVPLVLGYDKLFYWAHHDAHDAHLNHHLHGKLVWLNPGFFAVRYVIYFALWIGMARYFGKWSRQQDTSGDPAINARLKRHAGPAIIVFALSLNFFAFDVLMSLAPKWYSTIYGVNFFGGMGIGTFAFLTIFAVAVQRSGRLTRSITTEHYHDMGKWLFAFTFFWAYTAFSQFMLYWYGNIPEETIWYNFRFFNDWQYISIAVAVGHWAFPFLFLLSRWTKRIMPTLIFFCAWQIVFHFLDLYWNVMPNYGWSNRSGTEFNPGPLSGNVADLAIGFSAVDVLLPVALLLILVGAVIRAMKGNLIPVKDPNLGASLAFENY
jgi:hypothetical protein